MKLQPKKLIQADVAIQRKAQIDEGIALASKIDILRETLANEEGNLERFRKETITRVQAEIDGFIQKKESLVREITSLEDRKQQALIPLTVEFRSLEEAKEKFLKEKQAWGEKSLHLDEREQQIERTEKNIENEKSRAENFSQRTAENVIRSEKTLADAEKSAKQTRIEAQIILNAVLSKEKEVSLKEKEITDREIVFEQTDARQLKKDSEQAAHDKLIKDKYATLERTIKRINNG